MVTSEKEGKSADQHKFLTVFDTFYVIYLINREEWKDSKVIFNLFIYTVFNLFIQTKQNIKKQVKFTINERPFFPLQNSC